MFLSEVGCIKPDKITFFEIMRGRASFVVVFFHDMMCGQQGIVGSFAYGFKMLHKVGAGRITWFWNDLWISFPRMKAKSSVMRGDASGRMSMVVVGKFC